MARNNYSKSNKSKLILVLLLVGIFCLSLFGVACSKSETTEPPKYSYSETDDGLISNPTFSYGTTDIVISSYIKTSVTGWSKSKDTYSTNSSSVNSGIIKVTDEGWEEVLSELYSDSDFLKYLGVNKTDIKNQLKDENQPSETEDIKNYVIENYIKPKFPNPGYADGSLDRIVYMMNNYATVNSASVGLSQKITSTSEVTLEKGENAKITVWVLTQNITENGASIRISNSFSGNSQADVSLININTQGIWKKYTLFVEGDSEFNTSFKIALGLGYSLNYETQGTVYFDNIEVVKYTAEQDNNENNVLDYVEAKGTNVEVANLDYANTTKQLYTETQLGDNNLVVNLSLNSSNYGFTQSPVNPTYKESIKGGFTDKDAKKTEDLVIDNKEAIKLELTNAAYTLNINSSDFVVGTEKYAYVEFFVKNQLNKFSSTAITVNVLDIYKSHTELRSSLATVSNVSDEWQKVSLVIKNNFDSEKYQNADRTFSIQLVVGPTDLTTAKYKNDFATGNVYVSIPTIAKGDNALLDDESNKDNYEMFKLFSSVASGSTALYAGLDSDYADSSNTETYALTTNPSDIGKILTGPSTVYGYQGITANHFYINEETDDNEIDKEVNTRIGNGENGNFAGLINTKYLNTYKEIEYNSQKVLSSIASKLDFNNGDDDYQSIMIYNNDEDSYGFIGNASTINASSYAKVSVTLRVVDNAVANIYLVDVSETVKNVIKFNNPLSNEVKELSLEVTSDMMEDDGWVTVDFFVATGATEKDFRVEIWNGSRDAQTNSKGYVFIKDIVVSTSGAFVEPSKADYAFVESDNPLYNEYKNNDENITYQIIYQRPLTQTEKDYNKVQTDSSKIVSYANNYVWAQNATMIYAVYNTIDPVEIDPFANDTDNDDTTSGGCTAETDPSTFWLSFSSILLIVALIVAIAMLFIKNIRRRNKANRSDAKSHYKITSRVHTQKAKTKKVEEEIIEDEEIIENDEIEDNSEVEETQVEDSEQTEETLDSYVYGEVEVFGNEDENK